MVELQGEFTGGRRNPEYVVDRRIEAPEPNIVQAVISRQLSGKTQVGIAPRRAFGPAMETR
jgi:hypothetical protein